MRYHLLTLRRTERVAVISRHAPDILVAGAGPAGCAAAIGLRRLGYSVVLVHMPRPWPAREGISARTLEGLRNAGLAAAADTAQAASPRRVHWNGESSAANSEHLVQRTAFDEALLRDAAAAGVQLIPGRLRRLGKPGDAGGQSLEAHIEAPGGDRATVRCGFLVEARGRAAPAAGDHRLRGPETVSLLRFGRAAHAAAGSAVCALADGWAWQATTRDGLYCLQFSVTRDGGPLPRRRALEDWFARQQARLPDSFAVPADIEWTHGVMARGSTSILQGELLASHTLRVGDAAMAVDPLSGNGIFQALSCALIAPAVINTLLQYPADADLAAGFYRERVRHTFLRFARLGRDFYRLENRWQHQAFWRQRRDWPDDLPAHGDTKPALLGVDRRPVVADGRIAARKVAVTSDQPLGVWHVAGVELAPLLEDLPPAGSRRSELLAQRAAAASAGDPTRLAALQAWLRRYGLL